MGGVEFVVYTNWQLPHIQAKHDELLPGYYKIDNCWVPENTSTHNMMHLFHKPQPSSISCHSKVPLYDGQELCHSRCKITGGDCYCDGSGLAAQDLFQKFVAEGEEVVWKELERWYNTKLKDNLTHSI